MVPSRFYDKSKVFISDSFSDSFPDIFDDIFMTILMTVVKGQFLVESGQKLMYSKRYKKIFEMKVLCKGV